MTVHEFNLTLPDERTLHGYDTGRDGIPVMWHHGTPNVGAAPRPLLGLARFASRGPTGHAALRATRGETVVRRRSRSCQPRPRVRREAYGGRQRDADAVER